MRVVRLEFGGGQVGGGQVGSGQGGGTWARLGRWGRGRAGHHDVPNARHAARREACCCCCWRWTVLVLVLVLVLMLGLGLAGAALVPARGVAARGCGAVDVPTLEYL